MKKYSKEEIEKMRGKMVASIDNSLDLLADIDAQEKGKGDKAKQGKSEIVIHERRYEDDCITDYREKPYKMFLFVTDFWLKRSPKGRVTLERKSDVVSFEARTYTVLARKVGDFIEIETTNVLLDWQAADKKWFPSALVEKRDALKMAEKLT